MPWEVSYNSNLKIIELIYSGKIAPTDLKEALEKAVDISIENKSILFFADCSQMEGGHSVFDLYFLISLYEESGLTHGIKEAILLPSLKSTAEQVNFYETACKNKGFNVKVFKEKEEALCWLVNK